MAVIGRAWSVRERSILVFGLLGVLALGVETPSLAVQLIPQLGIAKAVGEDTEDIRVGISGGADILHAFSSHIAAGLHGAFTYFPVDGDLPEFDYSGSLEIIELAPILRVTTGPDASPLFFGQFGLGAYMAQGSIHGSALGETVEIKDKDDNLGLQLGAGVILGSGRTRFEVAPTFHLVFSEGETTKYFVVHVGVVLGE